MTRFTNLDKHNEESKSLLQARKVEVLEFERALSSVTETVQQGIMPLPSMNKIPDTSVRSTVDQRSSLLSELDRERVELSASIFDLEELKLLRNPVIKSNSYSIYKGSLT